MNQTIKTTNDRIRQRPFGELSTGESITLYQLTNRHGNQISITNYGGIITNIVIPDVNGVKKDVVLGYDDISGYENDSYYLGAIIGRYAGRIRDGKITIAGIDYQLPLNTPTSQLHGGEKGLNKQVWQAECRQDSESATLVLTHQSPDGDQGFPGEVLFKISYTFNDKNELLVDYLATTNKTTVVNLTQHSYFNLAGHQSGDISQHQLTINADYFLPMDDDIYPSGEIINVKGLPQDFSQSKYISQDLHSLDKQVQLAKGFDNYWLLNDDAKLQSGFAAQVYDVHTKIRLTLYTDQPALVFYSGNYLDGNHHGKSAKCYQQHDGFCLEPVRAVTKDFINDMTPVLLYPNQPFSSRSRYVFDWV